MLNNGASTEAQLVYGLVMFLSLVSSVLSLVVVVAVVLPLIREPEKRTPAASFNLYIVYLSLADALWMAVYVYKAIVFFCLPWEGTEDASEIGSRTAAVWRGSIGAGFCPVALAWIAAFVSHEVLKLLRNSKQRKRCGPPTLRRVALHGVVACAAGIAEYVLYAFWCPTLRRVALHGVVACAAGIAEYVLYAFWWVTGSDSFLIPYSIVFWGPFLYSLWVVFRIVREGLMRFGAGVGNRLNVLVVYFRRIVLVYVVVMGSTIFLALLAKDGVAGMDLGLVVYASGLVYSIEGWLNFAIIRTKPDVGKMIDDLFVGTACCCNHAGTSNDQPDVGKMIDDLFVGTACCCNHAGTSNDPATPVPNGRQTQLMTTLTEEESTIGREGGEEEAEDRREGNENNPARLSVQERVKSEFILGILEYLSDEEDDDDDDGGNGVNRNSQQP
eukprot:CAMPEP_0201217568 /NCGR_PEP_ID=MMETSP0851-20130426/190123_1 /ASSEMBLY_ACC=CAM_ASM_000631 /TAXON_ID=183588 /ORGANISM="Pseudo-nitzschia fraudulenta, Strain WWA7" /LENGTH=441 /DNA_ID=CAMNT_0047507221 /DNA_START=318 /DNA_END=1643 /DNA_ORIENTATION=+